jgi:phosphatidate cytidylyltransferase
MLTKRLLTAIVLIPVGIYSIIFGGWVFTTLIVLFLGVAAWEFWRLFRQGGYQPSGIILISGVILLVLERQVFNFAQSGFILSLVVILTMAYHFISYEKGRNQAATDFCITLGGVLYLGWLGGYLVSLRNLPDGEWWILIALPAVWFADAGAFFIGRKIGRHKLAPRTSPKKSWEGYIGGIVTAVVGSVLFALLWSLRTPVVSVQNAALLGLVISVVAPLGDLGESMIKRQFGVKDTSNIFPGHGGSMDRIDSWLWAVVIGYYLVTWFMM